MNPTYEDLLERVQQLESRPENDSRGGRDDGAHDLYRAVFQHMLHEVHVWQIVRDDSGRIATWKLVNANPAALESWQRSLADVAGKTTDEIFPGANPTELFMPVVEKIFTDGTPHAWEHDFPPTGQFLRMVSVPMGELFFSTGIDITQMRRREDQLSEALLKLRQAVDAGRVGLWDWDLVGNQVHYSAEWKRQIGYEDEEIGDDFQEWKSRLHPDDVEPTLARVREGIESPPQDLETTFRLRHKDGSYRWILATSSVVVDDHGTPVRMLGSHVDITARKQLERHLQQAQRLEAVGTLAGGIAHDFNNLLAAATMSVALARSDLSATSDAYEALGDAADALRQAAALTKQLLAFSKRSRPVKSACSLDTMLGEACRLMTSGSNCRCELSLQADLRPVDVDGGQVGQVFNNLVINAQQAMPEGGRIDVVARNIAMNAGNSLGLAPGEYVVASIADTGVGISAENLTRIFDPFFTTKQSGTGLGLATAHSIVKDHGGALSVESEVGQGTTFHVYLPASDSAELETARDGIVPGSGKVLVMDDEPLIRKAMQTMLTRLGYSAEVASGGTEAVERYEAAMRSDAPFDAAILDLTVVGEAGATQTVQRLLEIDPNTRAIVISGYAQGPVLTNYSDFGFKGRLRKPCDAVAVSQELERVLGPARGAHRDPS